MSLIKIGSEIKPSIILDFEEIKCTEITISCGGGMGGSLWEEYTTDEIDLNKNFINVNTNRAKNEFINIKNIVKTRPVKIVRVALKNNGNDAFSSFPVGTIKNYYYLVNADDNVEVNESYYNDKGLEQLEIINKNF